MKKQFKNLCPGKDILYECVIRDSVIMQDCVGNIIVDKYVPAVCSLVGNDNITIILQDMHYSLKDNGYIKEDRPNVKPKEERISVPKNTSVYVDYIVNDSNDTYLTRVNQRIIATTKRELVAMLNLIIKENEEDIDNMDKIVSKSKMKNSTMEMVLSCSLRRIRLEPEDEPEKKLTEEEFACMAL